jgi:hypothetical protein
MSWVKTNARDVSIIKPYRDLTHRFSIEGQYWTLAGKYSSMNNQSEIVQMVNSGLITQDQYYGSEIDPNIYNLSKDALKADYPQAHLYEGDIINHMTQAYSRGEFCPEIIYIDTKNEPERASELVVRVLDICNHTVGRTLIFANAIAINTRRRKVYTYEEWIAVFGSDHLRWCMRDGGWKHAMFDDGSAGILYPGNDGRAKSTMLTVILYRNI